LGGLLVTGARAEGNHGQAGSSGQDGALKLAQTSSSSLGQLCGLVWTGSLDWRPVDPAAVALICRGPPTVRVCQVGNRYLPLFPATPPFAALHCFSAGKRGPC